MEKQVLLEKEKYYVYLHRRAKDGVVFYVGKGCGNRAYTKERSRNWSSFIGSDLYEILFEEIDLSEDAAIDLESYLIENPRDGWRLVNKNKSVKNKAIDYSLVSEYLYYDESSPSCLRWKKNVGKINTPSFREKDSVAGSLHSNRKRYTVSLKSKLYYVHRIVVILHGVNIPDNYVINHKDCDSSNNKFSNLEVVSCAVNSQKKSDYVYNKENTGIRVLSTVNGWSVSARYVDITGKRINETRTTKDEKEITQIIEELSMWRNSKIEEKLLLLNNKG